MEDQNNQNFDALVTSVSADRYIRRILSIELATIRIYSFLDGNWNQNANCLCYILAADGLSFDGSENKVECRFCDFSSAITAESTHEEILRTHSASQPPCVYINTIDVGLTRNGLAESLRLTYEENVRDNIIENLSFNPFRGEAEEEHQRTRMFHPLFKQFASRMKRLESFESWKRDDICRTELADAGFVYYGVDNKVICYQCGCIVNDWFENADPWLIHAQSSPFCFHLYIKRGQAFIDSAREGREPFIEQPVIFSPNADRYTCKICFENEISTVFCPCNHAIACYECSGELREENCPWCRRKLCGVIRFRFFD